MTAMDRGERVLPLLQFVIENQRTVSVFADAGISLDADYGEPGKDRIGIHSRNRQLFGQIGEALLGGDFPMEPVKSELKLVDDMRAQDVDFLQADILRAERINRTERVDGRRRRKLPVGDRVSR